MTIYIIGHLCIDQVIMRGKKQPISMGGTAAFSSIVCSMLAPSEKVSVISKIGPDYPDTFLEMLKNAKVDTTQVSRVKNQTTRYVLEYYGNDARELTLKTVCAPITIEDLKDNLADAKLLYFGPIANEIPAETIIEAKEQTKALVALDVQGIIRHRDPQGKLSFRSSAKIDEMLPYVDIIKLDLTEAQTITGSSKMQGIFSYLRNLGVKTAIVTKGQAGSVLFNDGVVIKIPSIVLKTIYNTTGAGDCFFSSFLTNYLENKDALQAAQYATKVVSYFIGSSEGVRCFFV
ncbi:MAG: carbohydrate kinase family protein, partial [Candidatus Helarchaeota archaeon]|nr:carbohydrate kinase family protein [Candidatus Helarchaeota archaeon]